MTDSQKQFRTVRLSQGQIRYRDTGDGEPLVFIHGVLVNGELWRQVVPRLSSRYRCIVPDLPLGSHEEAMPRDADLSPPGLARLIADFLAALDLRSVTLIGNDTGGALCQLVATTHAERLARLVLTDCDAFTNFPPRMFLPLKWGAFVPGFLFELSQMMRFQVVRRSPLAFGLLSKKRIDNSVLDTYLKPAISNRSVRRDLGKVLKGVSSRYTQEAAKKLADFQRPVLLAWAPEDKFFPFAHAEQLSRILPQSQLERIEGALTFVPEDQPEKLATLIDAFVQNHPSATEQRRVFSVA